MSEARDAEAVETADTGADEAAFEAARLAEEAEGEPVAEEAATEEEGERPPVDWQKRAMDKEGLAAKERARRREAERKATALEDRLAKLEAKSTPKDEEEDLLAVIAGLRDDDDDPITDLAQVKKALKLFQAQQAQETEAEGKQRQEAEGIRRLAATMAEAEADFAADHPDYTQAVEHFKKHRREEFEDMGYSGQALERELAQDFLGLVGRAVSGGRDPAEVVYNLAKKRGFQSGKKAAEDKLKEIARAADAGRGATGGRQGETRLTPDQINKLKGAAYDSAWEKYREQERRAG